MICPERIDATTKALTDTYWLCCFVDATHSVVAVVVSPLRGQKRLD